MSCEMPLRMDTVCRHAKFIAVVLIHIIVVIILVVVNVDFVVIVTATATRNTGIARRFTVDGRHAVVSGHRRHRPVAQSHHPAVHSVAVSVGGRRDVGGGDAVVARL